MIFYKLSIEPKQQAIVVPYKLSTKSRQLATLSNTFEEYHQS